MPLSPHTSSSPQKLLHLSTSPSPTLTIQSSSRHLTYALPSLSLPHVFNGVNASALSSRVEIIRDVGLNSSFAARDDDVINIGSASNSAYTDHFLCANSQRALREIRGNEWLSEIMEKWVVRDSQVFYLPSNASRRGDVPSMSPDTDSSHHSSITGGSTTSSPHAYDTESLIAIVRMDVELAFWIKLRNKWSCFGRYKATRLNQQSSQQRQDQDAIIWACGENSFQYDYKVVDNLLVICYGATKDSHKEALQDNTLELEDTQQQSSSPNRPAPNVLSQKGLLGIIMYDLSKVQAITHSELTRQKREHTHSKYILQRPESHRIIPAHDSSIVQMKMSPNGKMVATASARGTLIRLFDTITGQVLVELRRGRNLSIMHSLSFSPSSRYLCCTSSACTMHLFDIQKGLQESKKSSSSSSWFSLESWLGKEVVSLCKYKDLRGQETMCLMPDDSTVYIINNLGDLLHLEFDPKQKDYNEMLRLVSEQRFL